jgi:hypothetical protein
LARAFTIGSVSLLLMFAATIPSSRAGSWEEVATPQIFFDDFSYTSFSPLLAFWRHGWMIRTEPGWPGVPGADWSVANISSSRIP